MSDLSAAFSRVGQVTLSRLDELLAFLEEKLSADDFEHAKMLLGAIVDPGYSAQLHDEETPVPVPVAEALDPMSMAAGAPGDAQVLLKVFGTGFVPASKIRFGTIVEETTKYEGPTTVSLWITRELFTGVDPAIPVTVINPASETAGGGGESNALSFAVTERPVDEEEVVIAPGVLPHLETPPSAPADAATTGSGERQAADRSAAPSA
jgi:hypothetical protein